MPPRILIVFVALLICSISIRARAGHASRAAASTGFVKVTMRNVNFRFTDRIAVQIIALEGGLVTNRGTLPVFDDKNSFDLRIDSGTIGVSTTALTNDLNDYVFSKPDAPLKKLVVSTNRNQLVLRGVLSKKNIPFETDGAVTATADGTIRVHAGKIKALHVPIKGLMDLLGIDTANLIDTRKIKGVAADKDDLILDPQQLFPAPQMRGRVKRIQVEPGAVRLLFGEHQEETISSRCGARNFEAFRGGAVRFGKLTMNDTDLELVDSDPSDPFDFSIDHYQDQLTAGYSKSTKRGGLCVYMPDYHKIKGSSATLQSPSAKLP